MNGKQNVCYRNDSLLAFYYELIELCCTVRKLDVGHGANHGPMALQMGSHVISYDMRDPAVAAEELAGHLVDLYRDGDIGRETVKIFWVGQPEQSVEYKKRGDWKVLIENRIASDREVIANVCNSLPDTFMENEDVEELCELLRQLDKCYEGRREDGYWKKDNRKEFLFCYFRVLSFLVYKGGLLKTQGVKEKVLTPLLHLGIDWTKSDENGKVLYGRARLTAPMVMLATKRIYELIGAYLLAPKVDETIEVMRKEALFHSVHQAFRYYLSYIGETEWFHAALPAYRLSVDQGALGVPIRRMSVYNSYQGIRELRLADKILFEYDQWEKQKEGAVYRVAILGDIYPDPLAELLQYLHQNRGDMRLFVDAYRLPHKATDPLISTGEFLPAGEEYQFYDYTDQLVNRQHLDTLIAEHDLLFIVDHCDLYQVGTEELEDIGRFRQRANTLYQVDVTHTMWEESNRMVDIYRVLTVFVYDGRYGYLAKRVKSDLLKYISRQIIQQKKAAYIYISDMTAFRALTCLQSKIVRFEKYNQKMIGIARFSGNWESLPTQVELSAQESGKPCRKIAFNMWQVVKHMALDHRVYFENRLLAGNEALLKNICFSLDYSRWKEKIPIRYYISGERRQYCQNNIAYFGNVFCSEVLENKETDVFLNYIKEAFYSLLYGACKSKEDILFLHILKKRNGEVGSFEWINEKDDDISRLIDWNCRYQGKKLYFDAFEELDREDSGPTSQYRMMNDIEDRMDFLNSLRELCAQMAYTDSWLHGNCCEILGVG